MKQKLTAALLALVMALSMVPALAADAGMDNFSGVKAAYTGFSDVPANAWYATALKSCYEAGLMNGVSTTAFDPNGSLTVGQAITMAARLHNIYNGGDGTLAPSTPWYQSAVDYALANDIIHSEDAAAFTGYTQSATRAQMAYLFANTMPLSALSVKNFVLSLPDVEMSDPFGAQIFVLYCAGVLTGNDVYGTFAPNSSITRRDACAIIARMAFPEQRRTVTLLEKVTQGAFSFGVNANSSIERSGADITAAFPDDSGMVLLHSETLDGYSGYDITELGVDFVDVFVASMTNEGAQALDLRKDTARMGAATVSRGTFTMVSDTETLYCGVCIFIAGDTLYVHTVGSSRSADSIKPLLNSLALDGSFISPAL